MESLLRFDEVPMENEQENSSPYSRKLVPWSTWSEWLFVNQSLFSDSPDSVAAALRRISTWRSRGCLPVIIEVTASIIEIQQRDPYFRKNQPIEASISGTDDQLNSVSLSEEILAMLYCMAIMRLVNGVVEKTRNKNKVSIAVAAEALGLPRKLIDIRHEGSHRELPALQVVQCASAEALCWLKSYYWEPQKEAIPFQGDTSTTVRKEIKHRLRDLAFSLKVKQNPQLGSPLTKGKRGHISDWHCGRKKFLTLRAGKLHSPKTGGTKTKIGKTLKVLTQLYLSFSSEVVSVLLEFLLKALRLSDSVALVDDSHSVSTILVNWELVITKFSNKEPELLLDLLRAVLEKIEAQESLEYENQHFMSSEHITESHQIAQLSSLFAWLVDKLKGIKPKCKGKLFSGEHIPKDVLKELLRKCLLASTPGNKRLLDSAIHLALLMGAGSLVKKMNKLSFSRLPDFCISDGENSTLSTSENSFSKLEESFHEARRKLETIKRLKTKNASVNSISSNEGSRSRWSVVGSWTPCPIGMLPRSLGSSGQLPILDFNPDVTKTSKDSRPDEKWELRKCSHKREASSGIQELDNCTAKKMKEANDNLDLEPLANEGTKGCLLIDGMWKKVGEEELSAIQSAVRILV